MQSGDEICFYYLELFSECFYACTGLKRFKHPAKEGDAHTLTKLLMA